MTNTKAWYDDGYEEYLVPTDNSDLVGHVTSSTEPDFVRWVGGEESFVGVTVVEIDLDAEGGVSREVVDQFRWILGKDYRAPVRAWSVRLAGDQYAKTSICTEIGRLYAVWYTNADNTPWLFQRIGDWSFTYDNNQRTDQISLHNGALSCFHDVGNLTVPPRGGWASVDPSLRSETYLYVGQGGNQAGSVAQAVLGRVRNLLIAVHQDRVERDLNRILIDREQAQNSARWLATKGGS